MFPPARPTGPTSPAKRGDSSAPDLPGGWAQCPRGSAPADKGKEIDAIWRRCSRPCEKEQRIGSSSRAAGCHRICSQLASNATAHPRSARRRPLAASKPRPCARQCARGGVVKHSKTSSRASRIRASGGSPPIRRTQPLACPGDPRPAALRSSKAAHPHLPLLRAPAVQTLVLPCRTWV